MCQDKTMKIYEGVVFFSVLTCIICVSIAFAEKIKCLKNPDLADYPVNVYYCEDAAKPECCEVKQEFTCCEKDETKNRNEQLQLWGLVGLVVVIGAFVLVCWKKDTYLCEGPTMKERCASCCKCCRKEEKEPDITDLNEDMRHRRPSSKNQNGPYNQANTIDYNPNYNQEDQLGITPVTARQVDPMVNEEFELESDSGRGSIFSLDNDGGQNPGHQNREYTEMSDMSVGKGKKSPYTRAKNEWM